LLQGLLKTQFAFVQETVVKPTNVFANFVKKLTSLVGTAHKVSVLGSVPTNEEELVYNLSVENSHTFFANNTLVHNCDEELPMPFYDEVMFRLTATNGIYSSGFTPTLNQLFWKQAMNGNKILPRALKMSVSMYECLKYEDGSPSRIMTLHKIKEAESKCKNETERQRRIFGKFVTEEGRAYFAFEHEKHVTAPKNYDGWNIYSAVDYGSGEDLNASHKKKVRKNHPAAIVFIAVHPNLKKGVVIKSWRGDGVKTTAGDVFLKYQELSKDFKITQACYDAGAVDFGTIASRNGYSFTKANKTRDAGMDLVNSLFKHEMLTINDDDAENLKLSGELSHVMVTQQDSGDKRDDDLCDALRYCVMQVAWDLSAVVTQEVKAEVKVARPMTEEEFQAMQIKMRRGESVDKTSESENWNELESEFDHWNQEYGQF
jgi:hypothetical protein